MSEIALYRADTTEVVSRRRETRACDDAKERLRKAREGAEKAADRLVRAATKLEREGE